MFIYTLVIAMERLIVCTVGFDEKLVLRSLVRVGFSVTDIVVLVYAKSGGEYEVKRVENAVGSIKELLDSVGVEYHDVVVSGMDFASDVATVIDWLKNHAGKRGIVGVITGGMRLMVVELLTALVLYRSYVDSSASIEIHVAREDGLYSTVLPITLFNPPPLTLREAEVLRLLGDLGSAITTLSDAVDALSAKLGVSRYVVYKFIQRLKAKGLIKRVDRTIELTDLGKLLQKVV